jgi:ribosomal protein S2
LELINLIHKELPQIQCGRCDTPGCMQYAQAIVDGDPHDRCVPGLKETLDKLNKATEKLLEISKKGGNILFVGTKPQARDIVQHCADKCSMFYIVERWLGGTLTNFSTIKKSIRRLII